MSKNVKKPFVLQLQILHRLENEEGFDFYWESLCQNAKNIKKCKNPLFYRCKFSVLLKNDYVFDFYWESSMNFQRGFAIPGRATMLTAAPFVCVSGSPLFWPKWEPLRSKLLLGKNQINKKLEETVL